MKMMASFAQGRPHFFLLLIIFNCGMAIAASTLTLFGDIAGACGYTSTEAGFASGLFMIGAVKSSSSSRGSCEYLQGEKVHHG